MPFGGARTQKILEIAAKAVGGLLLVFNGVLPLVNLPGGTALVGTLPFLTLNFLVGALLLYYAYLRWQGRA